MTNNIREIFNIAIKAHLASGMIKDDDGIFALATDLKDKVKQLIFKGLPKELKPEEGLSEVNWEYCIGYNFARAEIIKYLKEKLR